jgi:hypothetical protein
MLLRLVAQSLAATLQHLSVVRWHLAGVPVAGLRHHGSNYLVAIHCSVEIELVLRSPLMELEGADVGYTSRVAGRNC